MGLSKLFFNIPKMCVISPQPVDEEDSMIRHLFAHFNTKAKGLVASANKVVDSDVASSKRKMAVEGI